MGGGTLQAELDTTGRVSTEETGVLVLESTFWSEMEDLLHSVSISPLKELQLRM